MAPLSLRPNARIVTPMTAHEWQGVPARVRGASNARDCLACVRLTAFRFQKKPATPKRRRQV
jgi:hypothetical protein